MDRKLQEVRTEFAEKITGYITGAFGLVAGLAWNEAITETINYFFPFEKGTVIAKFIYAFVITIVLVIVTVYLMRWFKNSDTEQK